MGADNEGGHGHGGHATCDLRVCNKVLGLVSFFAAIGGFLFGYDLALIGGALLYIEKDFGVAEEEVEIVVAGTKIGAVFGTFIGGWLMQQFGRRIALPIIAVFFVAGPVAMAVSEGIAVLAIGRVLAGLGIGASAVVCPAYTAEMAPPSIRGAMVSMYEIMLCFGMLIAVLVDYGLAPLPAGINWRWMVGMPAIFGTIQFLVPCLLPESPQWLVSKGKIDEARAVLASIYESKDGNEKTKEIAEAELQRVRERCQQAKDDDDAMLVKHSARCCNGCACFRTCECLHKLSRRVAAVTMELCTGEERHSTRLVMIMALINQLCASTAIINYAPTLIVSLQGINSFNGTNVTTGVCMPCGGTITNPTGACGQWGYGEDPWVGVSYDAVDNSGSVTGQINVAGFGLDSVAGASLFTTDGTLYDGPFNAYGRALVVHDESGARVGCGCCAGDGANITLNPYPGTQSGVSGQLVTSVQHTPSTYLNIEYSIAGLSPGSIGQLHVHTGTTCSDASLVGGHLYAESEDADIAGTLNVCSLVQGYCTPAGDTTCICQEIEVEDLCDEPELDSDLWEACHFCDNSTKVFEGEAEAVAQSAVISLAKLVGMVIAILLIDSRYGGRRPLLIFGSYAMATAMCLLTVAVWFQSVEFMLVSMAAFILSFSSSWAGGFWVVVSEVFTLRGKTVAAPLATAVLFAAGALANVTFLTAYSNMGAGTFIMYAVISLAGAMYLQVYLPETKGKSLSDVQAMMRNNAKFGYVCGCWPCCRKFESHQKPTGRGLTYATVEQTTEAEVGEEDSNSSSEEKQMDKDADRTEAGTNPGDVELTIRNTAAPDRTAQTQATEDEDTPEVEEDDELDVEAGDSASKEESDEERAATASNDSDSSD